jgi:hypothetical protein
MARTRPGRDDLFFMDTMIAGLRFWRLVTVVHHRYQQGASCSPSWAALRGCAVLSCPRYTITLINTFVPIRYMNPHEPIGRVSLQTDLCCVAAPTT